MSFFDSTLTDGGFSDRRKNSRYNRVTEGMDGFKIAVMDDPYWASQLSRGEIHTDADPLDGREKGTSLSKVISTDLHWVARYGDNY